MYKRPDREVDLLERFFVFEQSLDEGLNYSVHKSLDEALDAKQGIVPERFVAIVKGCVVVGDMGEF